MNSNPLRSWRVRLILAALILGAILLPLPTHGADCSNAPLSRLVAGSVARVSYLGGGTVALYNFPGVNARNIGTVREGTPLTVERGPICAEGRQWFRVTTLDKHESGWATENRKDAEHSYALEPWQILVDLLQPDGANYRLIRVNQSGLLSQIATYPIPKLEETVGTIWPPQEVKPLSEKLAAALRECTADALRLNPSLNGIFFFENLPADTGQITTYAAPDSARLLIVRHLWRSIVDCDEQTSPVYGLDRVSLAINGREKVLFDVPANGRIAGLTRQDDAFNRVIDVRWSPDNVHAIAWASYGEQTRLIIIDSDSGTIRLLDEGIHPVWREHGEWLGWLRPDGVATMNLIISRIDGTSRQTLALPPTLKYIDARFDPLWNEDGTRLLACVRADDCKTVQPLEIDTRKFRDTLAVPEDSLQPYWVLHDSAILWQPVSGSKFTVQSMEGATRTLTVPLNPGETIQTVRIFPGGDSALVVIDGKTIRYAILKFQQDSVLTIRE